MEMTEVSVMTIPLNCFQDSKDCFLNGKKPKKAIDIETAHLSLNPKSINQYNFT
jgi:hypothetical protein